MTGSEEMYIGYTCPMADYNAAWPYLWRWMQCNEVCPEIAVQDREVK